MGGRRQGEGAFERSSQGNWPAGKRLGQEPGRCFGNILRKKGHTVSGLVCMAQGSYHSASFTLFKKAGVFFFLMFPDLLLEMQWG